MSRILLLQSRPEHGAAEDELEAFIRFGNLDADRLDRVRIGLDESTPDIDLTRYSAVLMGGGPANYALPHSEKSHSQLVFERQLSPLLDRILDREIPFFGACLGIGALVTALGGRMGFERGEDVQAVRITATPAGRSDELLDGIPDTFDAFVGHKEGAVDIPAGATVLATSAQAVQMIRVGKHAYGTQFHPELDARGLSFRLRVYREHGYFPAAELDELLDSISRAQVPFAPLVLRNFVRRYAAEVRATAA